MSWETSYRENNEADKVKEPIYRSSGNGMQYCILRIGKTYHTLVQVVAFGKHMERLQDTPNADPNIKNEIIIGSPDLDKLVSNYISDARYISERTVIAREMLLTASPHFFRGMSQQQLNLWVNKNTEWLQKKYSSNVLYVTLHRDESTPHLHILLSPKVYSEARGCYVMSDRSYFGNKYKLRELQSEYAREMKSTFGSLNRGIQGSRAKHIDIKKFYGILDNVRTEENSQAIFKNDILLKSKVKSLEATVKAYEKELSAKDDKIKELTKQLSKGKERER